MSANQWIADFAARLHQLEQLANRPNFVGAEIWLGGLFYPEAFITATRQAAAQKNGWSLEELQLSLEINSNRHGFIVSGNLFFFIVTAFMSSFSSFC
jgi:dynein heavy chain 1